jgi:hypothetical protein
MAERENVEVEVPDAFPELYDDELRLPLAEAIERLQAALAAIPAELRHTAVFKVHGFGDNVTLNPEVSYIRPETDEELALRAARAARYEDEQLRRDRAEFERLKAKFG